MTYMTKGKLLPLDVIKKNSPRVKEFLSYTRVYHNTGANCLSIQKSDYETFDDIIEVSLWENYPDRKIYRDPNSCLYYDEWFEWLGEEPPIIKPLEDDLWDISDW